MDTSALQFERFDAQGGRVTPIISFNKNGNLYLSAGLTKKYEISKKTHKGAALYYDRTHEVIAIKLLEEVENGMVGISASHKGGAFLNSKAFAIKYDMMEGGSLREEYVGQYYPVEERIQGLGNVLLVNLKDKK